MQQKEQIGISNSSGRMDGQKKNARLDQNVPKKNIQQQVCGTKSKTCHTMLYSSGNEAASFIIIIKTLNFSRIFHLPNPV